MEAVDYVVKAKNLLRLRMKTLPNHPRYIDIDAQLDCVENVLTGKEKDKNKLHKLTLGSYAGKEYDVSDPELAKCIGDVFYIASQIADGLKVELP